MSDLMIEAQKLTKRYGEFVAIDQLDFDVRRGQVVGFLGPNGAGKSTTMKILTCFAAPSSGTARVAGIDVMDDPVAVRGTIGYLPESTPLYVEMQVLEYLRFMAEMRGLRGEDARRGLKRSVEQTHLGDVLGKEIRALSKGYKQRVGLAQALIHEPALLILDEPMSGLDPNQAIEIRDLIREIGKQRTVILSTHNLAEVQVTCDRVLIVSRGKLVADDTPEALSSRAGRARFVLSILERPEARSFEEQLGRIPGCDVVRLLEVEDGERSFELLPKADQDLRPDIFRAAVEAGHTLVGLRREGQNLEQIFRELTTGEPAPASSPKAAKQAA